MSSNGIAVFWFRRDLRLNDNAGLYHALKSGAKVLPVFIFDREILDKLDNPADPRVEFIHRSLNDLNKLLQEYGFALEVCIGSPLQVWRDLLKKYSIKSVYCNDDYEPYALKRDLDVKALLAQNGIVLNKYKDHYIFGPDEVLKADNSPYTVFTPYSKRWKEKLNEFYLSSYPSEKYTNAFLKMEPIQIPALESIGFKPSGQQFPSAVISEKIIKEYALKRDFPSMDACSRLGIHFRFGTLSIREKARKALQLSDKWLNELIWRDFYLQIMAHFPHVVHSSFKPTYDRIEWSRDSESFEKWCEGKTGYPIVDAGMRELNKTGYMHNRVRMIVASFLTKHLMIDWRWGETYFAEKLRHFQLASNNGGWQWAAGCGVDAAPYFRIFNPALQTERFDKNLEYVRRWVPEFGTPMYPKPIIDHGFARTRCLEQYKKALGA